MISIKPDIQTELQAFHASYSAYTISLPEEDENPNSYPAILWIETEEDDDQDDMVSEMIIHLEVHTELQSAANRVIRSALFQELGLTRGKREKKGFFPYTEYQLSFGQTPTEENGLITIQCVQSPEWIRDFEAPDHLISWFTKLKLSY